MSWELREEERRRERERAEVARRREEFARDAAALAATPEGRRFFRWLLDQGDIFADDGQPGAFGAYRAGRRASALGLWRTLREVLPRRLFAEIVFGPETDGGASPERTAPSEGWEQALCEEERK